VPASVELQDITVAWELLCQVNVAPQGAGSHGRSCFCFAPGRSHKITAGGTG